MNSLHLPEDLRAEGKQGFGVLFSLNIKRMLLMHPESFHHFRIEKCLPQLGGIMFTFLCFPISFIPDLPPPQKLSSLLPYWKPALHTFFLPVCIFFSSSSFTLKLSLQLQLASCPTSLSPICHILQQSSAPSAAAGPSSAGKYPPLPWEEVAGLGGLVSPGEICSSNSCMSACGCRETEHHKSVLPLDLEDFVGVILGEIICLENICCHTISE